MRVAYFTNQYPKVSHSFVRREIQALERQGVNVERIALRGWGDELVDANDLSEREKTHYLLRRGLGALLPAAARQMLVAPIALLKAMGLALRLSRLSDRPAPYHLVYLIEACELVRWCRQRGISHLHVHFGTNPAEVALLARAIGGPSFSFTVHGPDEFDRPLGLHLREKIEAASHVVAISSYGRSQLYRWVDHRHWQKIHVVHCGLEASFFDPAPVEPFPTAPRLVCVGRLCEQKGQLLLLEALRKLRDREVDFHLVLAGDGEMRGELEQYIALHHLGSHVSITGWISSEQVRQELGAARIMVLASFAEGLPVVIMEAMALGRPVLSTSIAGIPELVRHGIDGWLIPAGDVDALSEALTHALATPETDLQKMGASARARVRERHSIDTEAIKLRHLFEATP
jgi:colanic acid/amylovoran biosynthesis glycosyltransferase